MSGFSPKDFADHDEYEMHRDGLERAQCLSRRIFPKFIPPDSRTCAAFQDLVECAVRLGYEAALGLPHKASDYGLNNLTLDGNPNKCYFCKHHDLVYGCESECVLQKKGLPCELEVKEHFD
jgi:hypothetical protein